MNGRSIYCELFGIKIHLVLAIYRRIDFSALTTEPYTVDISCENVSRPRNIPQIEFDSRCAFEFSIFSVSMGEISLIVN